MGCGAADLKYRFQWNFPIFFSPNDPNTLYAASQVLFKSTDGGQSWQAISPDLTRNDKSKQGPSGGPITKDNTSVEYYGTIFYVAESPLEPGVLWAGSDDGLVHVIRDGGKSWKNVTPKGMPEWIMINEIDASPARQGRRLRGGHDVQVGRLPPLPLQDRPTTARPGRASTRGIDPDALHPRRARRPGPPGPALRRHRAGLYVSFDDGGRWQSLQLNLPIVPVTDLTSRTTTWSPPPRAAASGCSTTSAPLREAAAPANDLGRRAARSISSPPAPAYRLSDRRRRLRRSRGRGGRRTRRPAWSSTTTSRRRRRPTRRSRSSWRSSPRDGKVIRTFQGKPAEERQGRAPAKARTARTPRREGRARRRAAAGAARPRRRARTRARRPRRSRRRDKDDEEDRNRSAEGPHRGGSQPLRLGHDLAGRPASSPA